ncbi:MAG: low molecular weight protein-tyrosine-phosphatase [Erythrobacter sp.]
MSGTAKSKEAASQVGVLFVCLGNICRSPMAQGAFLAAANEAGLHAKAASAGTASYHIGDPPDPRAILTAQSHGVDIAKLVGRQLTAADFQDFTHIFALDRANMEGIRARQPRHGTARVALLMDAVEGHAGEAVPDPYHGDLADFEAAWAQIDEAVRALVHRFQKDGADADFSRQR